MEMKLLGVQDRYRWLRRTCSNFSQQLLQGSPRGFIIFDLATPVPPRQSPNIVRPTAKRRKLYRAGKQQILRERCR
jgi:hypothetical protein